MPCQIDGLEGELCTLERHKMVRGRKKYKCGECLEEIAVGEEHEVSTQLFDGNWSTFRTCALCVEIRSKIFCSWTYGSMWIDLAEENVFTISLAELSTAAVEKIEKFWAQGYAPRFRMF